MAMRFSDVGIAAAVNVLVGKVDLGAGATANFIVYSGARPTLLDGDLDDQVPLVTFDLPNPAFGNAVESTGSVSGWTAALDTDNVDPANADDDGDAAWFQITDHDGNVIMDGTVSVTGGGGDAKISSVTVAEGVEVSLIGFSYTLPKGW